MIIIINYYLILNVNLIIFIESLLNLTIRVNKEKKIIFVIRYVNLFKVVKFHLLIEVDFTFGSVFETCHLLHY